MKRARGRWAVAAVAILCIGGLALWQWHALARLAIAAGAQSLGHVRVSFQAFSLSPNRAIFTNLRVVSLQNEPIAEVARLDVGYNLRDLFPGGSRLFGLTTFDADSPRVTIVRHADGSYNLPISAVQHAGPAGQPLIVAARVTNGSIDVIDQRPQAAAADRLYVRSVTGEADIGTATASHYRVRLNYGERRNVLYPVTGRGEIDFAHGYVNQRWTAAQLPIAAVANFVTDSPSLRFLGGMAHHLDARYVGLAPAGGTVRPQLVANAVLSDGGIAIAGLSKPVERIRGPVDAFDDGLLTSGFAASLAGTPVTITGGLYGLRDPRLRVAVRGRGDAVLLRTAFTQAQRLPIRGLLAFELLLEGRPAKPITWINVGSPHLQYATTAVDDVTGVVALDGREADIVDMSATYGKIAVGAAGRVKLGRQPGAVEMLVDAQAPAGGLPYAGALLPEMPVEALGLASADDPKAIAVHGMLWGTNQERRLSGIFNVDANGAGSIGPLNITDGRHALYARIALDRARRLTLGVVTARDFPLMQAHGTASGAIFAGESNGAIGGRLTGRLSGPWGAADAHGAIALDRGALRGTFFGDVGRQANFGATLSGTPASPHIAGTIAIAGGRYRGFEGNGDAGIRYADGTLQLHDTAVAIGPLFVGVAGTIASLSPSAPFDGRYDLAAQLHTSDVNALAATVLPKNTASLVQGSVDANVHIGGAGTAPAFAGTINSPEGSVNGLAFRDLHGSIGGGTSSLSLQRAHLVLGGSTAVALSGDAAAGRTRVDVNAPQTNLADFNDFFDAGDMFAGSGSLAMQATLRGTKVVATNGSARFSNTRLRRLELGEFAAHWQARGNAVASTISFGGPTGELRVAGTVVPATMTGDLHATARRIDLGTWLPMLGLSAPITGRLDAQTALSGHYPDVAMQLHAAIFGGTAGRLAVSRFEITASAAHGRGTLQSAILDIPALSTVASGTFGLRSGDRIALVAQSKSPDIGTFLNEATGKKLSLHAALDSTLHVEGTPNSPRLRDAVELTSLRYGSLRIPRAAAEIAVDPRTLRVDGGEVDLERGKALLSAAVPIKVSRTGIIPTTGGIAASVRADDVELSNFIGLLPKGTQTGGRVDGELTARGTLGAPELSGALQLRGGTFSGPMERSPITGITAILTLAGNGAQLHSHAVVGGGDASAQAAASLKDLRRPGDAVFNGRAALRNARLDLPDYYKGIVNASISLIRSPSRAPELSGDVALSSARIPLDAFLRQGSDGPERPGLSKIAFNKLRVSASSDVRVQSKNVDIGTVGEVAVDGTLAAPLLAGSFRSTGGSLNFYRNFNIESGTVRFESTGIVPDIDAVATTFVTNPATAIRLHVTGPATNMNLALASDPAYSRQQILGLLVGAQQFGAVQGVRSNGGTFSAASAVTNVALGQLNTAFTRNLLEPLNASLAGALGFSEVRITSDIQTGVGISAAKAFGKNLNFIYAQTFGYPRTQSITVEAHPSVGTGLSATAYSAQGPTLLALQQPQPIGLDVLNLNPRTSFIPPGGTNGFAFFYQRKFP